MTVETSSTSNNVQATGAAPLPQLALSLLSSLWEGLEGVWLEGLSILIAVHVYLHFAAVRRKRSKAGDLVPKSPLSLSTSSSSSKTAGNKRLPYQKPRSNSSSISPADEARQVHRFVTSLLVRTAGRPSPSALSTYEDLVHVNRVDLRTHISDDQNACSMYIALIGGTIQASTTAEGAWQGTVKLLSDMRNFGFTRSAEFYASIMKLHAHAKYLQQAFQLHDFLLRDGIEPDQAVYICLVNVCVALGETTKALDFFEKLSKLGPVEMRSYMTVLRVYSHRKDWRGAAQLLDRMQAVGTSPDNLMLNNVLSLCINVSQVKAAEDLLGKWKDVADVVSFNILAKGFSQQGSWQKSAHLLRTMTAEGPLPNLITFNTAMDCAVRAMQAQCWYPEKGAKGESERAECTHIARQPWNLLDQMHKLGLEPDRYTCSTLVKGMHLAGCSAPEIDRAVVLLRQVGKDALQMTSGASSCNAHLVEVIFNTLLDACVTIRDLHRMETIVGMMSEFNVQASAVTFGTLIKAYGQAGQLSRCHQAWMDMKVAYVFPTIVTYGCYMDACIRNQDVPAAFEIFESMQTAGIKPNAVIYTSLIRGFSQAGEPKKALQMYRAMREEGIKATSVTFNSVLHLVSKQLTDPGVLQEVIADMQQAHLEMDVVTYSILLKASCNAGDVESALSLFKNIRNKNLVLDQVAYNTLLMACSKADRIAGAEGVFEEMLQAGMTPTHITTSILVKMYGKARMLDKAISISERMERDFGRKPNMFVYTCLIQACVHNKHVRHSWEIFNRMLRAGIQPDAITYGTLIHGCVYLNKFDYAMTLVRHAYLLPAQPASCPSPDSEEPPVFAVEALQPTKQVPLQTEVLQTLLSALRRKEHASMVAELEAIISEHGSLAAPVRGCGA